MEYSTGEDVRQRASTARDRFGCVPVFWLRIISGNDLKVGCALMGRADANGEARASISQLAGDTGLQARSVRRALEKLENDGLAVRSTVGTGRRASSYVMRLSMHAHAQATGSSMRAGAQATASVRAGAQSNNRQRARDEPPGCAPARTLDCAPARTHTDNRIITDLAHAGARGEKGDEDDARTDPAACIRTALLDLLATLVNEGDDVELEPIADDLIQRYPHPLHLTALFEPLRNAAREPSLSTLSERIGHAEQQASLSRGQAKLVA
jgi:DNA-binding Lrp family transcriptional regulator